MNNLQKERLKYLKEILNWIIWNKDLSNDLIFKWWTSLMLFYNLDRFSEDLDFNFSKSDTIDTMNSRLLELWYKFEFKDTPYWKMYKVEYWDQDQKFYCIIDLAKYRYKTKPKYNIKPFSWRAIKVMSLSHNFAHKMSAFYERKKWRDIIDINFYLSKWVIPNNEILIERHNRDFKQNLVIFLKELQTPYINQRLNNALDQLHYGDHTLDEYKKDIIQNINKNYTNGNFSFNISYKENINSWSKIVPLTDTSTLFIDWKNINPKIKNKYSILNQNSMEITYWCDKNEKLYEYINNTILPESLVLTKNSLNRLHIK